MKRTLASVAAALCVACAGGDPYLELTAVQTLSYASISVWFSEPVSDECANTSLFALTNASTGDTLRLSAVTVNRFQVTVTVQSPAFVLTAGHVYRLRYRVHAEGNGAVAQGTEDLLADFHPPSDLFFYGHPDSRLTAWRDSAGTVLLLWTPDNRLGNTTVEVWRGRASGDSVRAASLSPNRSAYYLYGEPADAQYALRAVNPYGASGLSAWSSPQDAGVGQFPCAGVCLDSLAWDSLPAGFSLVGAATTCDRVEYRSDSLDVTLVRRVTAAGVVEEVFADTSEALTRLVVWCPIQ